MRSLPLLDAAAQGHGLINNPGGEGLVRRLPAFSAVAGRLQPGLALEALRLAAGGGPLRLRMDAGGLRSVQIADRRLPLAANGDWWLHYSRWQERPHLSAASVIAGEAPVEVLTGRVVLIGYAALGLLDTVTTPLGLMPGVETHAEAIDNLIDGRLLQRPRWARPLEAALGLLLAALALFAVPALRPALALSGLFALLPLLLGLGLLLFQTAGWLLDPANPLLLAALYFGGLLAMSLSAAQAQRRQLRAELAASREAQARIEGELDAARRIQKGMLPEPVAVLGDETRLDLAAVMRPARSVGGDLYDFCWLDDGQLYLMIGDVSGKGLPASLFMVLSKALIQAAALRSGGDPGLALAQANAALARDNPELLFITAVAMVLDLGSGRLRWSSAGHEPPWLLRAGEAPRCLVGEGGPPLCVLDGYRYPSELLQLQPGDALLLGTDGITEAENAEHRLYGSPRLQAWLAAQAPDCGAAALLASLEADVATFTAGAEPADDLTALVLRWRGPQAGWAEAHPLHQVKGGFVSPAQ